MKLPPYPKYKPSGTEWLGDVPVHWVVKRFGYLFRFFSGGTPSTTRYELWDGDIPWVSSKDMKSMVIHDTEDHISEDAVKGSATCKLPAGSLLIVNRSGILKHSIPAAVIMREMAINQDIRGCVPLSGVNSKFIAYLIEGNQNALLALWRQQGATVESLGFELVKTTNLSVPPPAEQRSIAAFLDRETGRVDRLVAKKRELIERLKEKRTALISLTVTRGLPPAAARAAGLPANPPLKPSGLEWLGEIPKHWEIKKLKYLASHESDTGIQIGPFGGMLIGLSYDDEGEFKVYGQENTLSGDFSKGQRWLTHDQFHTLSNYHITPGDVVFTRKGSIGGCSIVPQGIQPGIIDSDTIRLRVNKSSVETAFILYAFKFSAYLQAQVQEMKRGAILSGLNTSTIANLDFIVPPLPEQLAIASNLDRETAKLDALVAKVEEAVERLQEYRTALITAAVTGKIDVRKAGA